MNTSYIDKRQMKNQTNSPGFGEHIAPVAKETYKRIQRIHRIALAMFTTGIAMGAAIAIGAFIVPSIPISLIAIGSTSSASLISSAGLASFASFISLKKQRSAIFGVTNQINEKIIKPPLGLNKFSECEVFPCEDTIESFAWKKRLICEAKHNIIISGNYCGGDSFNEILNLIQERLKENKSLKVVIISSEKFINSSNWEKIHELTEIFPDHFELVQSPDIWHINPGIKKTTNHSKFLVIDYGQYFALGGSGIEDKYAYAKGLGDRENKDKKNEVKDVLGLFLPRGFRDQDFIFHSPDEEGVGRRVYIESLKLAKRWEGINYYQQEMKMNKDMHTSISDQSSQQETVAHHLLIDETKEEVRLRSQSPDYYTVINEYDQHQSRIDKAQTKILCTGPEQIKNPFKNELVELIQNAQERVTIDHMYFHPTDKVLNELAAAARRGVKITIITNGFINSKKSPLGHAVFAPRNRYNYRLLAKKIGERHKENLKVYEFKVKNTTLHKKVIIIDDYVVSGSSNLGYKSLETMSDHEINFITKHRGFADKTHDVVQIDVNSKYTKEIKNPMKKLNLKTIGVAAFHKLIAPLIG